MDLVEDISRESAAGPKARFTAAVSHRSFIGVEVPWALIYPTSEGEIPASASAEVIQYAAPLPSSRGAVM